MTRRRQPPHLMPLLAALIFTGAQTSAVTMARMPGSVGRRAVV